MKIEIKVKNACAAVAFFDTLNPFMFSDEDMPSFIKNHPQFFFMDPKTGESKFVTVDVPEETVYLNRNGDEITLCFEQDSTDRMARYEYSVAGIPLPVIEHILELDAIRVDGETYPEPDECRCPITPPPNA